MLRSYRMVKVIASQMAGAADGVIADYDDREFPDEPTLTAEIARAVRNSLRSDESEDGFVFNGVSWRAHVLRTGRGRAGGAPPRKNGTAPT